MTAAASGQAASRRKTLVTGKVAAKEKDTATGARRRGLIDHEACEVPLDFDFDDGVDAGWAGTGAVFLVRI